MRYLINNNDKFSEALHTSPMSEKKAVSPARALHYNLVGKMRFFEGATSCPDPQINKLKEKELKVLGFFENQSVDDLFNKAELFWCKDSVLYNSV